MQVRVSQLEKGTGGTLGTDRSEFGIDYSRTQDLLEEELRLTLKESAEREKK